MTGHPCEQRDDPARTWQLVMTGNGLHRITPEAQADMARLLDLDPSISHLTLEIGDVSVHVARDWPSDQYEEAGCLIDRIAASGVAVLLAEQNAEMALSCSDRAYVLETGQGVREGGVVEHERGRLAAELEVAGAEPLTHHGADASSHRGGAREGDDGDARVGQLAGQTRRERLVVGEVHHLMLVADVVEPREERVDELGLQPGESNQQLALRAPLTGKVLELSVVPGEFRNDATAPVTAYGRSKLVGEERGEKVHIFKYKNKSGYSRRGGHRGTPLVAGPQEHLDARRRRHARSSSRGPCLRAARHRLDAPQPSPPRSPPYDRGGP